MVSLAIPCAGAIAAVLWLAAPIEQQTASRLTSQQSTIPHLLKEPSAVACHLFALDLTSERILADFQGASTLGRSAERGGHTLVSGHVSIFGANVRNLRLLGRGMLSRAK